MLIERCEQCGFDGAAWTDRDATAAIPDLPARVAAAVHGLRADELQERPVETMWSIAEYVDHVREVTFGMRFLLDTAVDTPGTDLGEPPSSPFEPEARPVDVPDALERLRAEADQLHRRLAGLDPPEWVSTVVVGGEVVDAHWIARHAVHDATHHLGDIERLRALS